MQAETDSELYSFEIDWWLNCRDALCGVRSSYGGQVAAIESGGAKHANLDRSGSYKHPFEDYQVIDTKHERAFGMDRRLRRYWILLREYDVGNGTQHERVHLAHYTASWPSECDGEGRQKWPKGVEARLSQFAGVAIMLTPQDKRGKLYQACQKGDDKALVEARRRAEVAVREAHRAYREIASIEADAWAAGEPDRFVGAHRLQSRTQLAVAV